MEQLFEAVLSRRATRLVLYGPGVAAELCLRGGEVLNVDGVPGLLSGLQAAELPVTGSLPDDVRAALAAGFSLDHVLDVASAGLGVFLADISQRRDVSGQVLPWEPDPGVQLPLPRSVVRVFAEALRSSRPAEVAIAELSQDHPILVAHASAGQDSVLDPVALRTLRLAQNAGTLADVLERGGRGDAARTGRTAQALDLLLHLGIVRVVGDEPHAEAPAAGPPDPDADPTPTPDPFEDEPGEALPAVSEDELLEMADACAAQSPLALLRLDAAALSQPLTLQGLHRDLWLEYARYHPRHFGDADSDVREAAASLAQIMQRNRDALRDPSYVALRLRQLRAFQEPPPPPDEATRPELAQRTREAQQLVWRRQWTEGLDAVRQARQLDPHAPRLFLLDVFCRVARRELAASDGLLNIDSLWLDSPGDQAFAHVIAARILRAAGKPDRAAERLARARELDPRRLEGMESRTPSRDALSIDPSSADNLSTDGSE